MTSIEELIRQKLSFALIQERKRVAENLLEVIKPAATAPTTPGGRAAVTSTPKNSPEAKTATTPATLSNNDVAATASKKQAKMGQITAQRQKLQALQAKTSTAKDPIAMRQQIQAQQQKLTAMQQELTGIKEDELLEYSLPGQRAENRANAVEYAKAAAEAEKATKKANAASKLADKTNFKRHRKAAEMLHDRAEIAHTDARDIAPNQKADAYHTTHMNRHRQYNEFAGPLRLHAAVDKHYAARD